MRLVDWLTTPLRLVHRLLVRRDGWPRGPQQLWWTARGLWLGNAMAPEGPPEETEARAREALVLFDTVDAHDHLRHSAQLALASALQDQGRDDDAAEVARLFNADPGAPGVGHWWIAVRYFQAGRYAHVEAPARKALEAAEAADEPAMVVDAAGILALALMKTKRPEEAAKINRRGLLALTRRDEAKADYWREPFGEALLWHVAGDLAVEGSDEAIEAHEHAFEAAAETNLGFFGHGLANALHEAGQHTEAVELATLVLPEVPDTPASMRLPLLQLVGHVYLDHLDRPADALAAFQHAQALMDRHIVGRHDRAELALQLARAAIGAGHPTLAEEAATEVVELARAAAPKDVGARETVELFGRPNHSMADPVTAAQLVLGEWLLGQARDATGQSEDAIQALQSALGRCRDSCLGRWEDPVPQELEDLITADLRRLLAAR